MKTLRFIIPLFLIFISCASTVDLVKIPLTNNKLTIIPKSYSRSNNVTPAGKELLTLGVTIFNNSKESFLLDLDNIYLIDNKGNKSRVEFVSGIKHDKNGKILWNIPPISKYDKNLEFIIDDQVDVSELTFLDKKIKLLSASVR